MFPYRQGLHSPINRASRGNKSGGAEKIWVIGSVVAALFFVGFSGVGQIKQIAATYLYGYPLLLINNQQ